MKQYVDGYVVPIAKKNLEPYRKIAAKMAKIFRKHGALEVRECFGDDLAVKFGMPFTKQLKLKPSETVVFSWITYKSRAHRDRVNAAVMKDPVCSTICNVGSMPFNAETMLYGGFKVAVSA